VADSRSVPGDHSGLYPGRKKINDSTTVDMGNYAEFDRQYVISFKGFTLSVTDYFFPNGLTPNKNNYFNYKNSTTGHALNFQLLMPVPEKFPIQLFAGTLVMALIKERMRKGIMD